MYEISQTLLALPDAKLPTVLSMSYSQDEAAQCINNLATANPAGNFPLNLSSSAFSDACPSAAIYIQATNAAFAALTGRGVTLVGSSGDTGAPGHGNDECASGALNSAFPPSSPWVTAVGATQLHGGTAMTKPKTPICKQLAQNSYGCAAGGTEVVCSTDTGAYITSGGGFSTVAPQPAWQRAAVAAYLASPGVLPAAGSFNPRNRAYPDVAAIGHNFLISQSGASWPLPNTSDQDGTSISAPIWAGIISLVNAARLAAGKPTVGFANPAIYHLGATEPGAWHDVTAGSNRGTESGCDGPACSIGSSNVCPGFSAAPGFDAATGWGSPNVKELIAAWKEL